MDVLPLGFNTINLGPAIFSSNSQWFYTAFTLNLFLFFFFLFTKEISKNWWIDFPFKGLQFFSAHIEKKAFDRFKPQKTNFWG